MTYAAFLDNKLSRVAPTGIQRRPADVGISGTDPIMAAVEEGGDIGSAMAAHFRGVFAGAGQ